jgi:DNA helicase HerA-like ATPase
MTFETFYNTEIKAVSGKFRSIICSIVFKRVWELQEARKRKSVKKPCFLLVDEAHYLFPTKLDFPEQEFTLDWGIRIAGEGRKFGLYLLVCSQLPSKIHEHILTQCGNLVLMKMLSQSDIDVLRNTFSFVPETFMQMSKSFHTGDALIAGNIVPSPLLVHFEGRKTQEGGSDLKVNWSSL